MHLKHPVRRVLAMLLCAVLLFGMLPQQGAKAATQELYEDCTQEAKGVDLVIVMDLSSSMRYSVDGNKEVAANNTVGTWNQTRLYKMEVALKNLITKLQSENRDVRIAMADFGDLDHYEFADAVLDKNHRAWPQIEMMGEKDGSQYSSTATASKFYSVNHNNEIANQLNFILGKGDKDIGGSNSQPFYLHPYKYDNTMEKGFTGKILPKVYTGSQTINAQAFVEVSSLDAAAMDTIIKAIDAQNQNMLGTNYDVGLEYAYRLAYARQQENIANGADRVVSCIFMSDGAAMQYNYFSGRSQSEAWSQYLIGNTDEILTNYSTAYTHNLREPSTLHPGMQWLLTRLNKMLVEGKLWVATHKSGENPNGSSGDVQIGYNNGGKTYQNKPVYWPGEDGKTIDTCCGGNHKTANFRTTWMAHNSNFNFDWYNLLEIVYENWNNDALYAAPNPFGVGKDGYFNYALLIQFLREPGYISPSSFVAGATDSWSVDANGNVTSGINTLYNQRYQYQTYSPYWYFYNTEGKNWWAEAMKGDTAEVYPVINRFADTTTGDWSGDVYIGEVPNQFSGTTAPDYMRGKDYISGFKGLGMDIATIGFAINADDNRISASEATTVLKNIATDEKHFYSATNELALEEALVAALEHLIKEKAALKHVEVPLAAVAPTCTETGLTEGVGCANCSTDPVPQEVIPALGHDEMIDEAVAPTCTTAGKTEGKHCSVCNEVLVKQEVVNALGHKAAADQAVAPDCTNTGLTAGSHCTVCNTVLEEQQTVPAKGHTEKNLAAVAPTCTDTGLTAGKQCTVCGVITVKQEVVPALGHKAVTDKGYDATCTDTGLTDGKHCSVCNEILEKQQTVSALGHKIKDGICTRCGIDCPHEKISNHICDACGKTVYTVSVDADKLYGIELAEGFHALAGQDYVGQVIRTTTMQSASSNFFWGVTIGGVITDNYSLVGGVLTIPAEFVTGDIVLTAKYGTLERCDTDWDCVCIPAGPMSKHEVQWSDDYTSAAITTYCALCGEAITSKVATGCATTNPTCEEAGKKVYTATFRDFAVETTVVLDPTGHTVVTDEAVAPGCLTTGLTEGSHCSVCDTVFVKQETVEPVGHNYVDAVCTNCGDERDFYIVTITAEFSNNMPNYKVTAQAKKGEDFVMELEPPQGSYVGVAGLQVNEDMWSQVSVKDNVLTIPVSDVTGDLNVCVGFMVDWVIYSNGAALKQEVNSPFSDISVTDEGIIASVPYNGLMSWEEDILDTLAEYYQKPGYVPAALNTRADGTGVDCTEFDAIVTSNVVVYIIWGDCEHSFGADLICTACGIHRCDALGHDEVIDKAVDPTCTDTGLTEGSHCSVCGKVFVEQTVIDALGHDKVTEAAKAPTCTEDGFTQYIYCKTCKEVFAAKETVSALGHSFDEYNHCHVCGYGVYNIWVQGIQVTSDNAADVLGNGTVSYDATTQTLTLKDADLTAEANGQTNSPSGVAAAQRLNLVLLGENTITGGSGAYGISGGDLTVSGTGSLKLNVGDVSIHAGKVTVNGGEITGETVYAGSGDIVINGGTVIMTNSKDYALLSNAKILVNGGTVVAKAPRTALSGNHGVVISGGSVIAENNSSTATFRTEDHSKDVAIGGTAHIIAQNGQGYVYENLVTLMGTTGWTRSSATEDFADCLNSSFGSRYLEFAGGDHLRLAPTEGNDQTHSYLCDCSLIPTSEVAHSWRYAACTEVRTCVFCGFTEKEARGHTEVIDKAVAPSCTATGLTEGSHCSVCGEVTVAQKVVDALGHDKVTEAGKAPTCTEDGFTQYIYCKTCEEVLAAKETILALGHSFDEDNCCTVCGFTTYKIWVQGIQVTNENASDVLGDLDDGATVVYHADNETLTLNGAVINAAECPMDIGQSGIAFDQNLKIVLLGENTINSSGLCIYGYKWLTISGTGRLNAYGDGGSIYLQGNTGLNINGGTILGSGIDILGFQHNEETYGDVWISGGTVVQEGTYGGLRTTGVLRITGGTVVAKTSRTYDMVLGSYFEDVVFGGDAHIIAVVEKSGAVVAGLDECGPGLYRTSAEGTFENTAELKLDSGYFEFLGDGHFYTVPVEGNDTEHVMVCDCFGGMTYSTAPHSWADAPCMTPRTCSICGFTETAARGHVEAIDEAVAPDCTNTGLAEGKHCSVCDEILVAQEVVPALGHNWVHAVCTNCGEERNFYTVTVITQRENNMPDYKVIAYANKGEDFVIELEIPDGTYVGYANCQIEGTPSWLEEKLEGNVLTISADQVTGDIMVYMCIAVDTIVYSNGAVVKDEFAGVYDEITDEFFSGWSFYNGTLEIVNVTEVISLLYSKPGYVPVALNTAADGSGTDYTEFKGIITSDLVLYIVWAPCDHSFGEDHICTVCGIHLCDAKGHTEVIDEAVAPGCTNTGLTEGKHCSVCGEILIDQEVIAKLHSFNSDGFCMLCDGYEPAVDSDGDGYVEIDNAGKLYWFATVINHGYEDTAKNTALNAVLTDNVVVNHNVQDEDGYLNGDGSSFRIWDPSCYGGSAYTGTFDGQGFTVSGLYYDGSWSNIALFGTVGAEGVVKNVGVYDCYFVGGNYISCVVGWNEGTVTNCYGSGKMRGDWGIGGVVGHNAGIVTNCYSLSYIHSLETGGNVVGENEGVVTNCYYLDYAASGGINGEDVPGSAEFRNEAQFAGGEVAYLLGDAWGQTIGKDASPVLGGAKVYQRYRCDGVTITYGNDPSMEDHSWIDATCTEPKTCSGCGITEGEALGHSEVIDEGFDATCTETGLTDKVYCSVCDEVLTDHAVIDALGHNYVKGVCTVCNAAVDYQILIGGVMITGHNAADVLGDGTVSYDPDTNTLTLNNANIVGAAIEANDNLRVTVGIYNLRNEKLNLVLAGDNYIDDGAGANDIGMALVSYQLTVSGNGTLTTVGGKGLFSYGLVVGGGFVLEEGAEITTDSINQIDYKYSEFVIAGTFNGVMGVTTMDYMFDNKWNGLEVLGNAVLNKDTGIGHQGEGVPGILNIHEGATLTIADGVTLTVEEYPYEWSTIAVVNNGTIVLEGTGTLVNNASGICLEDDSNHVYVNCVCLVCGEIKHSFADATCTDPKTCTNCGITEGDALGHSYSDGICGNCGEADPDYSKPTKVTGLTAANVEEKSFTVTWDATPNATKYWIYLNGVAYTGTTGTSITISNRTPDTSYEVKVVAVMQDGTTLALKDADALNVRTLEAIVTFAGTATEETITLTWDATGCEKTWIYMGLSANSLTPMYGSTTDTFTVTGLEPNTTYYFQLAHSKNGSFVMGDTVLAVKTLTPKYPIRVTGLKATNVEQKSFTVTWDATEGATKYWVYLNGVAYGSTTGTSFTIGSRTPNTAYTVKVLAVFNGGYMQALDKAQTLTVRTLDVPVVIPELTAAVKGNTVILTWDATGCDNTWIYVGNSESTMKPMYSSTTGSFTVTGLDANTTYYFKLAHSMSGKFVESKEFVTVKTQAAETPVKVTGMKATSVEQKSFTVTWDATEGATKYWVYLNGVAYTSTTGNSITVSGRKSGTAYEIKVVACLSDGTTQALKNADALTVTTLG